MASTSESEHARLSDLDLRYCWHPFTQMQTYEPKIIVEAKDCIIKDIDGKEYLDAFAGLWTVAIGHGRQEVADAVYKQMSELPFFSLFRFSTGPAIELAARLGRMLPGDVKRVFLTLGGSESIETALKIARQYWRNVGQGGKFKFISRERAFHGSSFGATAAQGLTANRVKFEPHIPGFSHVAAPYCYRCRFGLNPESCDLECAADLEREILFQGPESVAAFLGEVVMGTGGVIPPHPDYWRRVREICDRYDVLLIADEVVTGFGRTGKMFGIENYGIVPDMMAMAKGISSGYMPMGALGVRDYIYEAFLGAEGEGKDLAAGCTFDGHPACCAAALANLAIIERENLVERAAEMGSYLQTRLQQLLRHPTVGEVRGLGLLAGIELVADRETKQPFPPEVKFGARVQMRAWDLGVFCRLLYGGYNIALAPALIINKEQIDRIVDTLDQAIGEVTAEVSAGR